MTNGGNGPLNGQIAFGNALANNFIPTSRLHLHQTSGFVGTRNSTDFTGSTFTDGFLTGWVDPNGSSNGLAFISLFEPNADISYFTNDGTASGVSERLKVTSFASNGFIGMGNVSNLTPNAQLHINTIGANANTPNVLGELIRTDGLETNDNAWRMFTGQTIAASTEKGVLFTSPNTTTQTGNIVLPGVTNAATNHFVTQASQGDLVYKGLGNNNIISERMRMTGYAYLDQFGNTLQRTRVSISSEPNNPVNVPLASLHIGRPAVFNRAGHRTWMDFGTYYNSGNDQMYVGMKSNENPANTNPTNRFDAVINWGDDTGGTGGPDVLRFIFTSNLNTAATAGTSGHVNGIETMRIIPNGNIGMGDFSANGTNLANPITHKLDIDGDLRIREVAEDATLNRILAIDNVGGVHWKDISSLSSTVLADNGCSIAPANPNTVQWGQDAGVAILPGTPGPSALINNRELPLNGHTMTFMDDRNSFGTNEERIQIGTWNALTNQARVSKLTVVNGEGLASSIGTQANSRIGAHFLTSLDQSSYNPPQLFSPYNFGNTPTDYLMGSVSIASDGAGTGHELNVGSSNGAYGENARQNIGSSGKAFGSTLRNTGIIGIAGSDNNLKPTNTGVFAHAQNTTSGGDNFGVRASAVNGHTAFGVYGEASGAITNWAGFFNGNTFTTSGVWTGSDEKLKQNIQDLDNASEILEQLNSKTYTFKTQAYSSLNFPKALQYGLIAQELEKVLPELVTEVHHPAQYNANGELTNESMDFKAVQYSSLIPILIEGHKEQQKTIDNLKEEMETLNARLNKLESLLQTESTESNTENTISLSHEESVVLNQNQPNPFTEKTLITYFIPSHINAAQIVFYDQNGKIIKTFDINTTGKGELTVYGNNLSKGIYHYSLITENNEVLSKKMIKINQ